MLDTINDLQFILNKIDVWLEFATRYTSKTCEIEIPDGSLGTRIKWRVCKAQLGKETHCCKRKEAKVSRNKNTDALPTGADQFGQWILGKLKSSKGTTCLAEIVGTVCKNAQKLSEFINMVLGGR